MNKLVIDLITGEEAYVPMSADDIAASQPSLASLQAYKAKVISDAAGAEITAGFASNALGSAHTYSSELEDQVNLIGAMQIAQVTGGIFYSCTEVSTGIKAFRAHTAVQMTQVFADGAAVKLAALQRNRDLQDALVAATSIADIDALTW